MRTSSVIFLIISIGVTVSALPNQVPLILQKSTSIDTLSDVEETTLPSAGCFCAGGSICCYFGDDLDCDHGICGIGA
ncbi:hypothetical protein F5Y06DRAFT_266376 [Hypoxylon sp. FL0890]|nr:hypothetical protein F5Y06DRAFT_266376 [Hypoxylon sp. FL0890]